MCYLSTSKIRDKIESFSSSFLNTIHRKICKVLELRFISILCRYKMCRPLPTHSQIVLYSRDKPRSITEAHNKKIPRSGIYVDLINYLFTFSCEKISSSWF